MSLDEAIYELDHVVDRALAGKGHRSEYIKAREALIKAARDEALTKFANDLRESLLKP